MGFIFIILLFVGCVFGCRWLFLSIFDGLSGSSPKETYVDKTTHIHHHYHDNRSIIMDGEEFKKTLKK